MYELLKVLSNNWPKSPLIKCSNKQWIYLSTNNWIYRTSNDLIDRHFCKLCSNGSTSDTHYKPINANNYVKSDYHLNNGTKSGFVLNYCRTKYLKELNSNLFIKSLMNRNDYNINTLFGSSRLRSFHTNAILYEKDSSKVEQTVKALREEVKEKQVRDKSVSSAEIPLTVKEVSEVIPKQPTIPLTPPKRSLLKRIWDELVHYYHGFRLLFIDVGVASKLIWKILNGGDLTRREHRQLVRTSSDVFRLLPFSVFIIVPFMELLLPVFLKLFPSMLPSTFQTSSDKESKVKKELKLKLEMAKFLQNTLDEMTLQAKGETHSNKAKEFAVFFDKIRKTGEQASNEDIMKFSKLFEDEITLDSLSRPQLVALCRLLELQPIGTNNFLRFQLRMKLRSLKADDQVIHNEGIENLTVPELQQACRDRGMRALGIDEDRLRSQLSQWLELSLSEHIPPSLLLLSRVLYLPENIAPADQLKATIQSLPEEAATEAKYKIGETEGKIDNKTKIELIRKEQEAIRREKEEEEALAKEKVAITETITDEANIQIDRAVDLGVKPQEKAKEHQLSKEDIVSIEGALENYAEEKRKLIIEKEEFEDLKEEMKDYEEDIEEFKEITVKTGEKGLQESKGAKRLRNKVDKMVNNMDKLFTDLETKKETLQQKIDILAKEGKAVEREEHDFISINELLQAIRRIQKVGDDAKLERIVEVLDTMDVDHDGQIEVEHVIKVIELLGRENVKVTSNQIKDILKLLIQEDKLEEEEKKKKLVKQIDNNNSEKNAK